MKKINFLKTWAFAHRGLHNLNNNIAENTIEAYDAAIKNNFAIELDITMLKDGTIVCFHDKDLKRSSNINIKLSNLTYDEIKDIQIFNTNNKIPTFHRALTFINGKVPLLIEIKAHKNYKLMLPLIVLMLKKYKGEYAIFSFSPFIINWFKLNHPNIIRGQITSYFPNEKYMPKIAKYLMKSLFFNKFTKPDFISYDITNLPNKYATAAKEKGLTVISYTATNQNDYDLIRSTYDNVVFENFIPKI